MWRGALIGFGNVALHGHLPGWRRRRRRRDRRGGRHASGRAARAAAAELPRARWYDSAEALLASEALDFVDICTPPSSHAALAQRALERGLHVLCEKPLVGSPDELRQLTRLARERRRILHTVHNWNHAPIVRRTRELIEAGAVGDVTSVVWHTLRARPAAAVDTDAQLARRPRRGWRRRAHRPRLARLLHRPGMGRDRRQWRSVPRWKRAAIMRSPWRTPRASRSRSPPPRPTSSSRGPPIRVGTGPR